MDSRLDLHYSACCRYEAGQTFKNMRRQGWLNVARKLANGATRIGFETDPSRYKHWKLSVDGDIATLAMDVDEKGGLLRRLRAEAQFL